MTKHHFSLVTTCLNERDSLPRWRADVEAQTRFPDELVIVDSESTDGTLEGLRAWAAADSRIRIHVEKCSLSRGRNRAIELARHDRILSTDMGVRLDARWVEEMCRPFEEQPDVDVVMGNYEVDLQSIGSAAARAELYVNGNGSPFISDGRCGLAIRPGVAPGNRSLAYTREIWSRLGGLPDDLTYSADDSVFGRQMLRSGCKLVLAPAALVYWERPRELQRFWKEQRGYGRGDGEAAIKMPCAFRWHLAYGLPASWVPWLTAVRWIAKARTFTGLAKSLARCDVAAAVLILPLRWGSGYAFGSGYLVGYAYGQEHCQGCRRRLAPAER